MINLDLMSYKNYIWKYNPEKIKVTQEKNLKELLLPFAGNIIQNFGKKKRIVKGEGEFFGDTCIEDFCELRDVFNLEGSGLLTLPGIEPFYAVFRSLDMLGESGPNLIRYSFEFWEDLSIAKTPVSYTGQGYHVVAEGETLWSIALMHGINVDVLLKLNLIKRPDSLVIGERLRIL